VICAVRRPGRVEGAGGREQGWPQGVGGESGPSVSPPAAGLPGGDAKAGRTGNGGGRREGSRSGRSRKAALRHKRIDSGSGEMSTNVKSLVEINRRAIPLLYRELGVVDAVRFLKQLTSGLGDYTQECEVLFAGKTLEQIVSEIEQMRKPAQPALGAAAPKTLPLKRGSLGGNGIQRNNGVQYWQSHSQARKNHARKRCCSQKW